MMNSPRVVKVLAALAEASAVAACGKTELSAASPAGPIKVTAGIQDSRRPKHAAHKESWTPAKPWKFRYAGQVMPPLPGQAPEEK